MHATQRASRHARCLHGKNRPFRTKTVQSDPPVGLIFKTAGIIALGNVQNLAVNEPQQRWCRIFENLPDDQLLDRFAHVASRRPRQSRKQFRIELAAKHRSDFDNLECVGAEASEPPLDELAYRAWQGQ